jgi:hypothetical protein
VTPCVGRGFSQWLVQLVAPHELSPCAFGCALLLFVSRCSKRDRWDTKSLSWAPDSFLALTELVVADGSVLAARVAGSHG